jgi:hypothetical protein
MKKIALIAAFALAVPAWAQQATPPAEPAKPVVAEPAKPAVEEPAKAAEAQKPKAPRKVPTHPAKRQEDARHCLEKGSNTEIIKCAEAYL